MAPSRVRLGEVLTERPGRSLLEFVPHGFGAAPGQTSASELALRALEPAAWFSTGSAQRVSWPPGVQRWAYVEGSGAMATNLGC